MVRAPIKTERCEVMHYIGLLTHQQKQAGYFVSQDEDFVFLWHRRNGNPDCIRIFPYEDAKIKEVREAADEDIRLQEGGVK